MTVLAQKYRHRIAIERKVQTQDDDTGDITHSWQTLMLDSDTPLDEYPAEVLTGPGREPVIADAKQSETTARMNMPWFPGLTPADRIVWDGRAYDIGSIETDKTARREYRVRCTGGLTDGA